MWVAADTKHHESAKNKRVRELWDCLEPRSLIARQSWTGPRSQLLPQSWRTTEAERQQLPPGISKGHCWDTGPGRKPRNPGSPWEQMTARPRAKSALTQNPANGLSREMSKRASSSKCAHSGQMAGK